MATTAERTNSVSVPLAQRILGGIIGGIVGGLVFGIMMAMMGMLPMVASVVGSKAASVGFLYHMFNSVVIGALFGLVFGAFSRGYGQGAVLGLVYGAIWWVLGPLILMPLLLGMGGLQFGMALSPPRATRERKDHTPRIFVICGGPRSRSLVRRGGCQGARATAGANRVIIYVYGYVEMTDRS